MDLKKTITYKNNTYAIDYNFATERGINGKTHHNINIFQVNGKNIAPYNYSWTDMYYNKESIILKAKSAIDEYNKQISVNKFSYFEEYQNWNGNLDGWDE